MIVNTTLIKLIQAGVPETECVTLWFLSRVPIRICAMQIPSHINIL